MKTVGIIGGLGPETTSEFYLRLVLLSQKLSKESRPPILIYSVPGAYDIEEGSILGRGSEKYYLDLLIGAAQKLEKAGADFLVMPCNSLHLFIKEIRNSVKIPVLSILEETTEFLKQKTVNTVGIISTSITQKNRLYEKMLDDNGIKVFIPDKSRQEKVNKVIHNLVLHKQSEEDKQELIEVLNDFNSKGVEHVVLACTDLQLLKPRHSKLKIYDTMKIFAEATVRKIITAG